LLVAPRVRIYGLPYVSVGFPAVPCASRFVISLDSRRSLRIRSSVVVLASAALFAGCSSAPPERTALLPLISGRPADRCDVAGDSREAARLSPGGETRLRVRVPPNAVLRYGVAATSGIEAAWNLSLEPAGGNAALHDTAPASLHWSERVLDLATLGGHDVMITARAGNASICWGAPTIVIEKHNPALVVVILLDTVRADHLHLLGYARSTTDVLDWLAQEAVVFTDAASDVSWTRASVATLMTGQPSMLHGVLHRDAPLAETYPTMAELFRARGFRTVAFSTNPNVLPVWGFARGFDRFVDIDAEHWSANSDAARVFAAARAVIESAGGEHTLLYIHVNDAHAPYDPPIDTARALLPDYVPDGPGKNLGANSTAVEVAGAIDRYDAELAYVDRQLGEFFSFLRSEKRWDEALVVLVGDHGEEFRDHGGVYHGHTLFREQLHVPLVMKLPGLAGAGQRVTAAASMVDVLPTMLAIVGHAAADLPGRVLVDRQGRPDDGTSLPRFATTDMDHATVYAVEDDTATLIVQTRPTVQRWLFDRRDDRSQRHDLSNQRDERQERLQTLLDTELLSRRRGWHVRICGSAEIPGRLTMRMRSATQPFSLERVDLEPEDELRVDRDGTAARLVSDLRPQQSVEEHFGRLVPRAKADRDELAFSGIQTFDLEFEGTTLPVLVGLAKEPVRAPSLNVALVDAITPAVFAPDCPGFGFVYVWHSGTPAADTRVDAQTLDRLRALGYAH
jgi:arylsulfatase A-like enzyme